MARVTAACVALVLGACRTPPTDTPTPVDDTGPPTDTDTDVGPAELGLAPLEVRLHDPDAGYPGVDLTLLLLPLDDGGLALAAASGDARNIVALDRTETQIDPSTLQIDVLPGSLHMPLTGLSTSLSWTELTWTLVDTDGDGVVDGGTGRMAGTAILASSQEGWVVSFDGTFEEVALDTRPGSLLWVAPIPLLPGDPVGLRLSEPARAGAAATLSVGGPVPLEETPFRGGLAVALQPLLDGWIPWGTTLAVDGADLTDAAGNPFGSPDPRMVVADPGDPRTNLGFESDVGWAMRNGALGDAPAGLTPSDGARVAVLENTATLVGELSVGPGDTTISLDIGVVADFWDSLTRVRVVQIAQDGTRTVSWTSDPGAGAPCDDCGDLAWRIDVQRVTVPIAAPSEPSVLLVVETEIAQYLGLPRSRVIVDAVGIE